MDPSSHSSGDAGTRSVRPDPGSRQPTRDKPDGPPRDESHRAEIHPDTASRQPTRDESGNQNRDERRVDHHDAERDGQKFRFSVKPSVTVVYGEPGMGKTYMLKQMIKEPTPGGPLAVMVLTTNPEEWDGSEGDETVNVPVFTWSSEAGPKFIKKIIKAQSGGGSLRSPQPKQTGSSPSDQREPDPGRMKRVPVRPPGPAPHLCLILDDLLVSVDWSSKYMGEIFIRHRHLNLSLIIVAHNITTRLPPLLKDNAQYLVMFELRTERVAENIFHSFSSGLWASPKELFAALQGMRETRTYCVVGMREQKYWYASEGTHSVRPGKAKRLPDREESESEAAHPKGKARGTAIKAKRPDAVSAGPHPTPQDEAAQP